MADRPVLCMGEILVDFIAVDGDGSLESANQFLARSGGAPANVAVALARLGVPSAFCGVTGSDPLGQRLRHELIGEGIDTSRLRTTAQSATTIAFAWKDERGNGHFWILRGADATLDSSDAEAAGIENLAALVIGSVALSAEPSASGIERAVALARQSNVAVVFDVNLRPTLWSNLELARTKCERVAADSTLVKLSLDDARGLFGADSTPETAIERILAVGAPAVVLTDGDRGCWYSRSPGAEIGFVPAFAVDAVEPTGAGDAFTAAMVARALGSGWAPFSTDDITYAAAAGALATTRPGAWEGLPTRESLASFLSA